MSIALGVLGVLAIVGTVAGISFSAFASRQYPQTVPGFGLRMRDCPYDARDVAKVLRAFRQAYPGPTPQIDKVCVAWHNEPVAGAAGVTDNATTIRLMVYPTVYQSALAHELVHVMLKLDPQHKAPIWDSDFVARVNRAAEAM